MTFQFSFIKRNNIEITKINIQGCVCIVYCEHHVHESSTRYLQHQ